MERIALTFLKNWLSSKDRKPLIIRGARQVGKTWLVRHFAKMQGHDLVELNLERRPELASLFISNDPQKILINLEDVFNRHIDVHKSLIFLDEIQTAPELLAKLRWFAEDLPELPIIAAGSLLEFVLTDHTFSMPVGRISYMHLEPFSFEEFLLAHKEHGLLRFIDTFSLQTMIPEIIHKKLIDYFHEYVIVGGMPQSVASWVGKHSLEAVDQIHLDLLATYRDDFAKYSKKISRELIDEVMMSVPKYLGQKFVYSKIDPTVKGEKIKQSLDMLCKARICHRVLASAANGVPLAAEINESFRKIIFLDIGLCSTVLGLSLSELTTQEVDLINKGGIAEQYVGQILRTLEPPYKEPALYYWQRHEKGSSAEIDYVIQQGSTVIPLEVKAGKTGTLKSLHLFMSLKKKSLAFRMNSDYPNMTDVKVQDPSGTINYTLLSVPFYLVGQIHRLTEDGYRGSRQKKG